MRYQLILLVIIGTGFFAVTTHARDGYNKTVTGQTAVDQNIESQYDADDDEPAEYTGPEVPVASDLLKLAAESRQRDVPILLMFSAEDCDYCERLEEDIVQPMLLSGEFDQRAIFRKVMIDSTEQIRDFHGSARDPEEYADKKDIQVTPTLMFVDSKGNELVPKVIGYQMGGLFMAYLDMAIKASSHSLKQSLHQAP